MMEWLDPWWSTENHPEKLHESFQKQLERETPPGHVMYQVPAKLIARGTEMMHSFKSLMAPAEWLMFI